ncbi:MAG: hypothetical protein GOP50_07160 [Candidatus Heimdallarchaeota archaeon]|nr:hypothetical protein [Candidatus Heimdallarchaeota archaeon]
MANGIFNSFLIVLGFCMLGLPIILISVTTAPPGIEDFNSSIMINTIDGDAQSPILIHDTAKINGSSPDYWDEIAGLPQLPHLNNISQLIVDEVSFMENVSMLDYYGLSTEVHVFELEMTITSAPLTAAGAKESYTNGFGNSNGSFYTWMWQLEDWNASHISQPNYPSPSINDTLDQLYSAETIEYEINVDFYANIMIDGVQMTTQFSRLLFINDSGYVVFFLSDETEWTIVS